MPRKLLAFAAFLTTGLHASACRKSAAIPVTQRASDSSIAARVRSAAPSDTSFFEVSRHEERGVRNAGGGCSWGPGTLPGPGDTLIGVLREEHSIWVDPQTCVKLVAFGYRRAAVSMDTAGHDSRSLTATVDFRPARTPRKPERP
jgi:hypothetical protein